ncbi:SIS domain-containing protein [soil metagenome]
MVVDRDRILQVIGEHLAASSRAIESLSHDSLASVVKSIAEVHGQHGTVWTIGNGGSSALANHLALGLSFNALREGGTAVRAICLSTDAPVLTGLANDFGYEEVFAQQLAVSARPGDLLIAVSSSGTSSKTLAAAQRAKEMGVNVISFTGTSRSPLAALSDLAITIENVDPAVSEDAFMAGMHAVYQCFMYFEL